MPLKHKKGAKIRAPTIAQQNSSMPKPTMLFLELKGPTSWSCGDSLLLPALPQNALHFWGMFWALHFLISKPSLIHLGMCNIGIVSITCEWNFLLPFSYFVWYVNFGSEHCVWGWGGWSLVMQSILFWLICEMCKLLTLGQSCITRA